VIEKLVPLVRWLLAGPSGLQMKGFNIELTHSEYIRKMTCRHAKSGTKSGTKLVVRFFLCPISAFCTRCPLGKEKKRTFTKSGGLLLDSFFTAFVPLLCRNISYIISVRIYEYSLSPTVSSDFINQTALREERGHVMRLLR
jgi:hypothetical protein